MITLKEITKNIANMIKVKTLVTIAVVLVFCILALRGQLDSENVMYITTSIVGFYFGTQHERQQEKQIGK